jgi:hypothetical protein
MDNIIQEGFVKRPETSNKGISTISHELNFSIRKMDYCGTSFANRVPETTLQFDVEM